MSHNGFRRTYAALKQLYYWKGMKKDVLMHCKHHQVCAKQKVERTKYIKDNFRPGSMPMEFISMYLVGRLSKTSSGHEYALTVICMLTGYVFCIPLKKKQQRKLWTNTSPMLPSHSGTAERSCQTMVQSSKTPCLRKWPNNWELKGRSIHWCTGPKLMDISKDFTSS